MKIDVSDSSIENELRFQVTQVTAPPESHENIE